MALVSSGRPRWGTRVPTLPSYGQAPLRPCGGELIKWAGQCGTDYPYTTHKEAPLSDEL